MWKTKNPHNMEEKKGFVYFFFKFYFIEVAIGYSLSIKEYN